MATKLNLLLKTAIGKNIIAFVFTVWGLWSIYILNRRLVTSFHGGTFTGNSITSFDEIKHQNPLDEQVLRYLRLNHLVPPSTGAYDLQGELLSEYLTKIREIFKGKTNGFFIECGANDGEFFSSTLDLEINQNWTGLLVEANPPFAEKLLKRISICFGL